MSQERKFALVFFLAVNPTLFRFSLGSISGNKYHMVLSKLPLLFPSNTDLRSGMFSRKTGAHLSGQTHSQTHARSLLTLRPHLPPEFLHWCPFIVYPLLLYSDFINFVFFCAFWINYKLRCSTKWQPNSTDQLFSCVSHLLYKSRQQPVQKKKKIVLK